MTYKLAFNESALKEWKKLGHTIQEQFKKKLRERLENPRVPASQFVIGVGKRENDAVYKVTQHRS
ncbi:type II toxin-antitoxin system RelE/ParE family toxin [Salmonella enterica]|nr:hypothetical protein [Salmonella enterica]EBZ1434756.1 hypothetical protein [Salmonella enterica subsp. enterica serovar Montevideo]EBZ2343523.1 hypothetical protein [Salmonella enterica subsp. enterica serovar Montevideo]ECO0644752.1 hypothetical protein [Salmonella enterica subsp. enterica serovar Montevideo]ECT3090677.1 hypothetical protein [Salmonella enterica subsp. enterica serovar Montevideo]